MGRLHASPKKPMAHHKRRRTADRSVSPPQHTESHLCSAVLTPRLGEGFRMPDGGTKLPAALAIASEGALTLIGASLNKLVFSTILRSRRRPMQEASAYVKVFGCRPVVIYPPVVGPASESLRGRNPRGPAGRCASMGI